MDIPLERVLLDILAFEYNYYHVVVVDYGGVDREQIEEVGSQDRVFVEDNRAVVEDNRVGQEEVDSLVV